MGNIYRRVAELLKVATTGITSRYVTTVNVVCSRRYETNRIRFSTKR